MSSTLSFRPNLNVHVRVPSPISAEVTDSESDFADEQNSVLVQSFVGLNCSISANNPFQRFGKYLFLSQLYLVYLLHHVYFLRYVPLYLQTSKATPSYATQMSSTMGVVPSRITASCVA